MIVERSPLRVCLAGGGTDLPEWYENHGGDLYVVTLDLQVTVCLTARYGQVATVCCDGQPMPATLRSSRGRYLHALTQDANWPIPSYYETSISDAPIGTGLGGSGAYAVALARALCTAYGRCPTAQQLAEWSFRAERNILREPVGKQDHYAAAFAHPMRMHIALDGTVTVHNADTAMLNSFIRRHLVLVYTNEVRADRTARYRQQAALARGEASAVRHLEQTSAEFSEIVSAIEDGDVRRYGNILNTHWSRKRIQNGMSSTRIDDVYDVIMHSGAVGAKLVGGGSGGFFLACADDRDTLAHRLSQAGVNVLKFNTTGARRETT